MPAPRRFDTEQVSTLILEAIDLGLPMVSTLVAVMDLTDNQARYLVRTVRADGYLGVAPHQPARAMIHRGAVDQKSWLVCQECTTAWPCDDAYPYGTKNQTGRPTDERRAREPQFADPPAPAPEPAGEPAPEPATERTPTKRRPVHPPGSRSRTHR